MSQDHERRPTPNPNPTSAPPVEAARPGGPRPTTLAQHDFLTSLPADARERLLPLFETVTLAPGACAVEERALDRAFYLVLAGEGRVVRGGVEVGTLLPGQHFGELALVVRRPRAATVVAHTALSLARLGAEAWDALVHDDPDLALLVLEHLLSGVAERLTEVTDSVGLLLRERSLPRRLEVEAELQGQALRVRTGTEARQLLPSRVDDALVVAALVDRTAVSLITPVTSPCRLEPLTEATLDGQRILRHSQALLLLEAAHRVAPGLEVALGHSMGVAQRVQVRGHQRPLPELCHALAEEMDRLVRADLPLREEWWTVGEAREHLSDQGWSEAALLLDTTRASATKLASYGELYAPAPGPLLPRTGALQGQRLVATEGELLLVYGAEAARDEGALAEAARQAARMTSAQEVWLGTLGVDSVGALNHACIRPGGATGERAGDVAQLIRVSEGFHEKRLGRIADAIAARAGEVRVVSIAGPSSSGKTTFIQRLRVQLQVEGLTPVGLSLDDYYVDREHTPRDAAGEYDYEALEALRLDLLAEHLTSILRGEAVRTARYDFTTGRSHPEGGPRVQLGPRDLLMLEGIHGLNPSLLDALPRSAVFRVFVCPLAQLPFDRLSRVHASDVRLLRRIVRDRHGRGATAAQNLARWPSVRTGERRHIFPFQGHADAVFDTSLVYELGVLKVFAERYLLEVPRADPTHVTAARLLGLLDRFVTLYPDQVPPTSLLREFIGGSGFERGP